MNELIQNRSLEAYISKRENLEVLETQLEECTQGFSQLKPMKGTLDFGDTLTWDNFWAAKSEAVEETTKFLNTKPDGSKLRYSFHNRRLIILQSLKVGTGTSVVGTIGFSLNNGFQFPESLVKGMGLGAFLGFCIFLDYKGQFSNSEYDNQVKVIKIGQQKTVPAAHDVSHEYTHFIQEVDSNLPYRGYPAFFEGHAEGVARNVSRNLSERHDNPAYLYGYLEISSDLLRDGYIKGCRRNHTQPNKHLTKTFGAYFLSRTNPYSLITCHRHEIGFAAFSIAEAIHGPNIYREVLAGNFDCFKA